MMKKSHGGGYRLLMGLLILALAGVIAYLGVVGMVCWKETHVPQTEGYDAIVVLGAQVKPDGTPSVQLQWRLDAAYGAWQEKQCLIVTCGAQGSNEPDAEGRVMKAYLTGLGVPENQVLVDDTSFNTRQNLENAAALLQNSGVETVLIVTSDYHLPRAMALAEDQGLTATGLGSPTKPEYWIKNHAREAIAWLKYWAEKYLGLTLG